MKAAIADAMRKQEPVRLGTLRMLKAALMNREIERGRALDDSESLQVVASLVKQRRDSIEQFTKGGRQDLVDKEAAEIRVLETYLPPAADPALVERAIDEAIGETGAASPKDIGRAMKAVIGANVAMFFLQLVAPVVTDVLALRPVFVVRNFWVWELATYMFLYGGLLHILFNMLALWMFGTELERVWGTRYFLKFYFVTGIGAGILTVLFSLLPFSASDQLYRSDVIGASGAIYGLLLAYALYFPDRPIYMYLVFPIP